MGVGEGQGEETDDVEEDVSHIDVVRWFWFTLLRKVEDLVCKVEGVVVGSRERHMAAFKPLLLLYLYTNVLFLPVLSQRPGTTRRLWAVVERRYATLPFPLSDTSTCMLNVTYAFTS